MDLVYLSETLGDDGAAQVAGVLVGLVFGAAAQSSRFCLRSATMEFWRGGVTSKSFGPQTSVWLLAFFTTLAGTQALIFGGLLDPASIRQINAAGTLSGAIAGGAIFGLGMILARGCASRLLVLAGTGNLRALVTGLVLTVVAQASLRGVLAPPREALSNLVLVDAATRDMTTGWPEGLGIALGLAGLVLAVAVAWHNRIGLRRWLGAIGVGLAIVSGWWLTYSLSLQSFDPVPVQSVTFTGPSADTLMAFLNTPSLPLSFSLGLVPGVFAGSAIASLLGRQFKIVTFDGSVGLPRYLFGAGLMGFGGMLAGGCAVGAGVTGGSVFALTAWVALLSMWISAGLADRVLDGRTEAVAAQALSMKSPNAL